MQKRKKQRVRSTAPNLRYQSAREEKQGGKTAGAFVLCLLLPPVGIAWAWRETFKSILPRIALTLTGIASMTLILTMVFSAPGEVDEILPSPVVPLPFDYVEEPAAPAPGGDVQSFTPAEQTEEQMGEQPSDADGGIPEGAAPAPAPAAGGDTAPAQGESTGEGTDEWSEDSGEWIDPEAVQAAEPTPEPVMVYCVSENATLYHAADICDGQENRQAIPLTEAQNMGLLPCEKCTPPGI